MSQIIKPSSGGGPSGPDLHVARYIVSAGGTANGANFTTVASAYAAAVAAGGNQTVFLQPGLYIENITMSPNVDLAAFSSDSLNPNVAIRGTITANYSGIATISGICLQAATTPFLTCSGSTTGILYLKDCNLFTSLSNGMALSNPNFVIYVLNCFTTASVGTSLFQITATNGVEFDNCRISASDATTSTISSGFVSFSNCVVGETVTISGSGTANYVTCVIKSFTNSTAVFTTTGGQAVITNSTMDSGTAVCIDVGASSTVILCDVALRSLNANAVSGTGSLNYGDVAFYGSSTQFDPALNLILLGSTPADSIAGNVLTSTGPNTSPTWQAPVSSVKPSFYAYMSAVSVPATGQIIVPADTLVFGNPTDYNTTTFTFTAPNTGIYQFGGSVYFSGVTFILLQFVATSITVPYNYNATANQQTAQSFTALISMTAGDTCTFQAGSNVGVNLQNSGFIGGTFATFWYGYQVA